MDNLVNMIGVCCDSGNARTLTVAQIRNGGIRVSGFRGLDVLAINSIIAQEHMRCTYIFSGGSEIQLDVYPMDRNDVVQTHTTEERKTSLTFSEFASVCGDNEFTMETANICNAVRRRLVNTNQPHIDDRVFIALENSYNIVGMRLVGTQIHVYESVDTRAQYSLRQAMTCPLDMIQNLIIRKQFRRMKGRKSRRAMKSSRRRAQSLK